MKNMFENNTLWQNFGQTISRRIDNKDEKYIELNFEARVDELGEVLGLAMATGLLLNTFELPDTEEYDTFSDFLFFCKKISEALPKEEDVETAQITLLVTEYEIKATDYILTQGMTIISRGETITNETADKAILIESFRRRIMKAAGE